MESNQTTELDRVKAKIHALSQKKIENGCTDAEAEQAMDKVGELLDAYNLSMDEVMLSNEECRTITWKTDRKSRHPMDVAFMGVATFCDCRLWGTNVWDKEKGNMVKAYKVFGLVDDTKMATYLMNIICEAYQTELDKFKQSDEYQNSHQHGRVLTTAFYKSMARSLHHRLIDMKDERDAKYRQEREEQRKAIADHKSTDLVLAKKKKVEEEFEKLDLNLVSSSRSRSRGHRGAANAGYNAGNNVNLSRPIKSGGNGHVAGHLT